MKKYSVVDGWPFEISRLFEIIMSVSHKNNVNLLPSINKTRFLILKILIVCWYSKYNNLFFHKGLVKWQKELKFYGLDSQARLLGLNVVYPVYQLCDFGEVTLCLCALVSSFI